MNKQEYKEHYLKSHKKASLEEFESAWKKYKAKHKESKVEAKPKKKPKPVSKAQSKPKPVIKKETKVEAKPKKKKRVLAKPVKPKWKYHSKCNTTIGELKRAEKEYFKDLEQYKVDLKKHQKCKTLNKRIKDRIKNKTNRLLGKESKSGSLADALLEEMGANI